MSEMGRTWAVVDDTGQRCKMIGFTHDLVKSDIPVCSSKTVIEVGTQKVLLGMHEALYLKNNTHGLLSKGQAWEFGTWGYLTFIPDMEVDNALLVKTNMDTSTTRCHRQAPNPGHMLSYSG